MAFRRSRVRIPSAPPKQRREGRRFDFCVPFVWSPNGPPLLPCCYRAATGAEPIREHSGPTRTRSDSHKNRSGLRLEDWVKKNCQHARIGSVVRDLISGNLFVFILLVVIIIFWRFGRRFGWFAVSTIALL